MLRAARQIKRLTASGGGTLSAGAGESFMIRGIQCVPSTNDTYLTLRVDKTTVGYWRIKGKSGNHLASPAVSVVPFNLMEWLIEQGINLAIPVAEGQDFSVVRYAEAGDVVVIYDIYDGQDRRATEENGSEAAIYTFLNYLNVGTPLTAAGDAYFNVSLSPSEFPDFPAGSVVPAKMAVDILGLVGSPWVDGQAGPVYFYTQYLKFIKDRSVMFDEDRNGLPFLADITANTTVNYSPAQSVIGPGVPLDFATPSRASGLPLLFNPPMTFDGGTELQIKATMAISGAATWTTSAPDLALIQRIRRVA